MAKFKNKKNKYSSYNELAWTEEIIALPDDYSEETENYVKAIKDNSGRELKTLLHLGCGAGGHDYTFKKYFKVTGIDISKEMLKIARKRNPEVIYHCGDMRNLGLKESFDVVVIPDSIGYMTTFRDLEKVVSVAYKHLNPGGILLVVAHTAEDFKENNFVYTGFKGDTEITIFENNYISDKSETIYEATLIYLIRRKGKLRIYTDCHKIGIFKIKNWLDLFKKTGFLRVKQIKMEHLYDRFILKEGKYILKAFFCVKPF